MTAKMQRIAQREKRNLIQAEKDLGEEGEKLRQLAGWHKPQGHLFGAYTDPEAPPKPFHLPPCNLHLRLCLRAVIIISDN